MIYRKKQEVKEYDTIPNPKMKWQNTRGSESVKESRSALVDAIASLRCSVSTLEHKRVYSEQDEEHPLAREGRIETRLVPVRSVLLTEDERGEDAANASEGDDHGGRDRALAIPDDVVGVLGTCVSV